MISRIPISCNPDTNSARGCPDPYSGSYDTGNPQSFNRYSYVLNSPLGATDSSGEYPILIRQDPVDPNTDDRPLFGGGGGGSDGFCVDLGYEAHNADGSYGVQWVSDLRCFTWSSPSLASFIAPVSTPPVPPKAPPNNEKKNPFLCGSEAAGKISLAGGLSHIPGLKSGVGGFIVNAVGGNAFSGATDLIHSVATGEGGGHSVFYNMGQSIVAGPTQGFGAAFGGSLGKAIESSPWGADVVSVGLKALPLVGEYASGIGEAKLISDSVTYFRATAGCALGIVH